jgi:hypothetical protein
MPYTIDKSGNPIDIAGTLYEAKQEVEKLAERLGTEIPADIYAELGFWTRPLFKAIIERIERIEDELRKLRT